MKGQQEEQGKEDGEQEEGEVEAEYEEHRMCGEMIGHPTEHRKSEFQQSATTPRSGGWLHRGEEVDYVTLWSRVLQSTLVGEHPDDAVWVIQYFEHVLQKRNS